MTFQSVNPATEETLQEFSTLDRSALEERIRRSAEAFEKHRRTGPEERAAGLRRAAEILEDGRDAYARLMTLEMGKPKAQARAEVEKCAWVCRHYAEHGARYLADESVEAGAERTVVRYRPLGPVLAVMPWNYPFWQVFRFAAPALMAGNVVLLKHAPNVPQCAVAIEGVFRRAGFVEAAFQNLFIEEDQVESVLDDPAVRAVTLTGSVGAGRAVGALAGRRAMKTVLELGGSDPFVVMASADLEEALEAAVRARVQNSGQSCIAAKRLLLDREIAGEFRGRLVERFEALEVGDPSADATEVGPLARRDLLEQLERQVEESVAAGARVLTGGRALDRPGWFYAPTVLGDVPEGCPAYDEELFGPVATVLEVDDAAEAVRTANDTPFGLGAAVWTGDEEERDRFLEELEAGTVIVNGTVASDPRVPFGGVKASGHGRELGRHGIREFVNVQTVHLNS